LRITAGQVERLEQEIDAMNGELHALNRSSCRAAPPPPLISIWRARSPGGRSGWFCALAVEDRSIRGAQIPERLSDHLFVLGRRLNDNGARDVLWQPGATR